MVFSRYCVWLVSGLLLVAFLASCVNLNLKRKYAERRAFRIEASREAPVVDGRFLGALRVSPFRVPTAFEVVDLVYRIGENEFETDYFNEFIMLPGDMISAEIHQWFAASGVFDHVVVAGSQVDAAFVLEGTIPEFYADLRNRDDPKASIKLQAFLLSDSAEASGTILFNRDYVGRVSLGEVNAENYVRAAGEALASVLSDLERDLVALSAR